MITQKIGIIGCGNMGGAILYGALESKILPKENVYVYDINPAMMEKAGAWGVNLAEDDEDVCMRSDIILLAVKPQNAAEALGQCGNALDGKAMILLIDKNNMVREMLTNYQGADGILSVINQVIATGNAAEEDKKDEQGTDESGKDDTEKDNNGTDEAGTNDIAKDDAGTNDASSRYRDVKPENVRLSKTSLTYNGKAQKPAVSAKDAKGEQISSADYTVTYSNNINVGQAAVTIVFKNGYNGTIRKTFLIKPKGTALVKLTPKKRGFIVQWKKQKCQISGYEVQYATNKRFRSAKTMKNIKTKTTEMKAVKLKSRKTYYVRIRTCKTVKINGKNTKLYSGWSKAKSIVAK